MASTGEAQLGLEDQLSGWSHSHGRHVDTGSQGDQLELLGRGDSVILNMTSARDFSQIGGLRVVKHLTHKVPKNAEVELLGLLKVYAWNRHRIASVPFYWLKESKARQTQGEAATKRVNVQRCASLGARLHKPQPSTATWINLR